MGEQFKIPGYPELIAATPTDVEVLSYCGGHSNAGVEFTADQVQRFKNFYGFDRQHTAKVVEMMRVAHEELLAKNEKLRAELSEKKDWESKNKLRDIPAPKPFDASIVRLFEAGDTRNVFRYVERDGMRVMAFLSEFLEYGEDPVKLVAKMVMQMGYDVDPGVVAWVEETEGEPDV